MRRVVSWNRKFPSVETTVLLNSFETHPNEKRKLRQRIME
jgi:hypothetical protein